MTDGLGCPLSQEGIGHFAYSVLFTLAVFLVLAWKIAGWWGVDRWLLPMLGTPWKPGRLFRVGEGKDKTEK